MRDHIRIKPDRSRLREFAQWATAQTPKIGTIGLAEFGVPADQFVQAPEEVLVGALVDGHRYVSPAEDADNGLPEPGHQELLGVATPQGLTPPVPVGDPEADAAAMVAATSPATVQAAMDAVLLATELAASNAASGRAEEGEPARAADFAPLEDALADEEADQGEGLRTMYGCPLCPRDFDTERGRDSHRRQAHRED
ncbi:hypothetical protein [Streptomyces sp. NPDC001068]|uniref:hypothetical protein n=1 Tax=Streptomyces sp. NPDC001068 TaxID=3364544 RepID=UPI0036D0ACCD